VREQANDPDVDIEGSDKGEEVHEEEGSLGREGGEAKE